MTVISVYTVGIKIMFFIRDGVRQNRNRRLAAPAWLTSFPSARGKSGLSCEFLESGKKPAHGTRQRLQLHVTCFSFQKSGQFWGLPPLIPVYKLLNVFGSVPFYFVLCLSFPHHSNRSCKLFLFSLVVQGLPLC